MKKELIFTQKPDNITYEELQALLHKAHESNKKEGMYYSTADQSVETLMQKLKDAVTYVAIDGDKAVGTESVQFRKLNYWYHNGDVGMLKLGGVDPEYKGYHIFTKLITACKECAWERGMTICVTDTSEQNVIVRHLLEGLGYVLVDYCVYPGNNFYSIVYAIWKDGCPYSKWTVKWNYFWKRCKIRLQYKPGKINRFTGKKG